MPRGVFMVYGLCSLLKFRINISALTEYIKSSEIYYSLFKYIIYTASKSMVEWKAPLDLFPLIPICSTLLRFDLGTFS